jgi:hypothetical protein
MEFEEMQKVWDAQNGQLLYAINEDALHKRILAKKRRAQLTASASELIQIIANITGGIFIFSVLSFVKRQDIFTSIMAAWMLASAVYTIVSRFRRMKANDRFDRSMNGDLNHAISITRYQVRLSQVSRWNALPIATFALLSIWQAHKPIWTIPLALVIFTFGWWVGGKEVRMHQSRRRELETLKSKLENG